MDAGQLHKLARDLRDLAISATSDAAQGRPNAAEVLVAMDLFEHSPTTVGEIATRTGVAQSQVSAVASSLHAAGVVTREADPRDRRRALLVVPQAARKEFGSDRARRGIEAVIQAHLRDRALPSTTDDVAGVTDLLAQLCERLGVAGSSG
jgi:DNA-binding MarR family transcriptional regulator